MVVVSIVYGLNSIVEAWREIFANTLRNMDFVLTVSNPDVYPK